jgi:hypothetical protein
MNTYSKILIQIKKKRKAYQRKESFHIKKTVKRAMICRPWFHKTQFATPLSLFSHNWCLFHFVCSQFIYLIVFLCIMEGYYSKCQLIFFYSITLITTAWKPYIGTKKMYYNHNNFKWEFILQFIKSFSLNDNK